MTNEEINEAVAKKLGREIIPEGENPGPCGCPICLGILNYMTDIEAAWEVIDYLPKAQVFLKRDAGGWFCEFYQMGMDQGLAFRAESRYNASAPEAICKAFLELDVTKEKNREA